MRMLLALLLASPSWAALIQRVPAALAAPSLAASAAPTALLSVSARAATPVLAAVAIPISPVSYAPALAAPSSALGQLRAVSAAWSKTVLAADAAGTEPVRPPDRLAEQAPPLQSQDFGRMFELTRRVLSRPEAQKFLKTAFKDALSLTDEEQKALGLPERLKEMSESQFMLLAGLNAKMWPLVEQYLAEAEKADAKSEAVLAKVEEKWREHFKEVVGDSAILEKFKKLNDPTKPMRLEWADGSAGYTGRRLVANTPHMRDGKLVTDDLKAEIVDFIAGAETELMFNVFDFDLMDIADAMIAAAGRGVKITGGIDKANIDTRPAVRAVFDKLAATKGITMRAVDSVGLNHQKLLIRDWNDKRKARSILSSGNFTQSCIGPEGDLADVPLAKRNWKQKLSVPNANHMTILDGYLPAQVIANKLIQTLEYGLRGKEYPLGGAFKIFGAQKPGMAEPPYVVISFSPKGTLGDVNRDMFQRLILQTRGRLRALFFAASSPTTEAAIVERAKLELKEKGEFEFEAVADTPFTMREYSILLHLAGLKVVEKNGKKAYAVDKNAPLRKVLGKERFRKLLRALRVAPREYSEFSTPDGRKFNAKIHHKVIISGEFAIIGSSFNPSDNAESNNEQIMVTNDPELVGAINAVFDGLFTRGKRNIIAEAALRNRRGDVANDDLGEQYEHNDRIARRPKPQ